MPLNPVIFSYVLTFLTFLAHRTIGRAYMLQFCVRLSVVCNVLYIVAKRCVLPKNCLKKQTGNSGIYGRFPDSNFPGW